MTTSATGTNVWQQQQQHSQQQQQENRGGAYTVPTNMNPYAAYHNPYYAQQAAHQGGVSKSVDEIQRLQELPCIRHLLTFIISSNNNNNNKFLSSNRNHLNLNLNLVVLRRRFVICEEVLLAGYQGF
jgi:hypothetical protein